MDIDDKDIDKLYNKYFSSSEQNNNKDVMKEISELKK
jgi:hypothetical protein